VSGRYPLEVLRQQIAPDATDAELAYFAAVCARLDLDPFADQIVFIGRYNTKLRRKVHRHQVTVAGRRALASRTGRPYRVDGPVWCGPRNPKTGELEWRDVWDDDEHPPYCARCLVYFVEFTDPAANGTVKWSEFAQFHDGKLDSLWKQMPSHMLGKVAESLALRRAFPEAIDPAVLADLPMPDVVADLNGGDDLAELVEASAVNAADDPDPVPGDWHPSSADQRDAHKAIGSLDDEGKERFLADWRIDTFAEPWPADAVADALSRKA
jgi:hypothetical protein